METKKTIPEKAVNPFEQYFKEIEQNITYWEEQAKLEFTEKIVERMEQVKVSKSELASKLGVRPGFVTRLLSGENNFTIETMVRIARALNSDFRCHLQPAGTETCWIDVLKEEPTSQSAPDWKPNEFQKAKIVHFPNLSHEAFPLAS